MKKPEGFSVRTILMGTGILAAIGAAAFSLYVYTGFMERQFFQTARQKVESLLDRLAGTLSIPLWDMNDDQTKSIVSMELLDQDIDSIFVYDEYGTLIVGLKRKADGGKLEIEEAGAAKDDGLASGATTSEIAGIRHGETYLGYASAHVSMLKSHIEYRASLGYAGILAITIALAVALVIFAATDGIVTRRIRGIVAALERFAQLDYSARASVRGAKEISRLASSFNDMADTLQKYNTDLETLVEDRSNRLIESEKFALLGSLVAGVAHEVNTPIGIGVTAATHAIARTEELKSAYREDALDETLFYDSLDATLESLAIINANLNRAGEFIRTFKKIAVDQAREEKSVIGVRAYLDDIVLSLRPLLKNPRHAVTIACEGDLFARIVPGFLYQIMTNLVLNSVRHAYPDGGAGSILIRVDETERGLRIAYEDDGCGIDPAVEARIFEPFFTTKRDKGGTGLGLYIVRSLLVHQGGDIAVERVDPRGTRFVMSYPCETSRKGVRDDR